MRDLVHFPSIKGGMTSNAVTVVFLTRVSAAERRALLADLDSSPEPEEEEAARPDLRPAAAQQQQRTLAHVPWVRRSAPDTSRAIWEIMGGRGMSAAVFADAETMRERAAGGPGSVAVVVAARGLEEGLGLGLHAARVGVRRAKLIVSSVLDSMFAKSLVDVLPDYESCKIGFPAAEWALERGHEHRPGHPRSDDQEYVYVLPAHLPVDLRLTAEEPTLVSLVHLEDSEMEQLRTAISDGVAPQPAHVRILNWPAGREPGTWDEMYRIFCAIRPPFSEGINESFALFVDRSESEGSSHGGDIEILMVQQKRARWSSQIDSNLQVARLNKIESTLNIWRAMFDQPAALAGGSPRERSRRFGEGDVAWLRNLSDPDRIILSGNDNDLCYVFLLCPMSKTQVQSIREEIGSEYEVQLVDVSRHVATPDIRGLVDLIESAEFQRYSEPPGQFVAVDKEGLDDRDLPCVAAEKHVRLYNDADGWSVGSDSLGYGWGRSTYGDAMMMWENYSTANLSLEEHLEEDIRFAYWSDVLEEEVRKLDVDEDRDEDDNDTCNN